MPTRTANAEWKGDLKEGSGTVRLGSGAWEGSYSFRSRFEDGGGTNPEELIAAAHAGCFSMALSHGLAQAGHTPQSVKTTANVQLNKQEAGFRITEIELVTEARVPGLDEKSFLTHAEKAKSGCPVSQALAGTKISLQARLIS